MLALSVSSNLCHPLGDEFTTNNACWSIDTLVLLGVNREKVNLGNMTNMLSQPHRFCVHILQHNGIMEQVLRGISLIQWFQSTLRNSTMLLESTENVKE